MGAVYATKLAFITRDQFWPPGIVVACVCPSVCQSVRWVCLRDNSSPNQARITKFGPYVLNTSVKMIIVLWGDWSWPSRSNLTSKEKNTRFWSCEFVHAISHHRLKSGFSKFGLKMHLSTVKISTDFGIDWVWAWVSFLISNLLFSTKLCVPYSFAWFCKYLVRPSPVSVPHLAWLRTYTDSYACRQGPAMGHEAV